MKFVRCAECGMELMISRKAMPKYNMIIDVVPVHKCPPEPIEFNPKPDQLPVYAPEPTGKFVQKLNELQPPPDVSPLIGGHELGDRRPPNQVKEEGNSSAPDLIKKMIEDRKRGD